MSIQDENVTDNVPFRNCTARMTGGGDDDEEDMLKRSPASGTAVTANAPCSAPSSRGSRESRILHHVTTLSGRAWFGVISSKVDDACVVKHDTDVVV